MPSSCYTARGVTRPSSSIPISAPPSTGPGQPLDLTKFYLIIPDAIGHGKSSKPSDGLRAHFPHYDYEDIVAAQHRLVIEKPGVIHLRLVMGLSMGGMHTWLWGERYPGMMDGLFPISALPVETGGRNRLWRRMIVEMIRNDPEWNGGDYQKQLECFVRLAPMLANPLLVDAKAPLDAGGARQDQNRRDGVRRADNSRKTRTRRQCGGGRLPRSPVLSS